MTSLQKLNRLLQKDVDLITFKDLPAGLGLKAHRALYDVSKTKKGKQLVIPADKKKAITAVARDAALDYLYSAAIAAEHAQQDYFLDNRGKLKQAIDLIDEVLIELEEEKERAA